MTKYRDRVDILADVLEAATENRLKTKIMYSANLNHKLLSKYLEEALTLGFVSTDGNGYGVTEKGLEFLERYNSISSKYSRVERMSQSLMLYREALERMCEGSGEGAGARSGSRRKGIRA
jgi:predicted transcriptional regulator